MAYGEIVRKLWDKLILSQLEMAAMLGVVFGTAKRFWPRLKISWNMTTETDES